MSVTVFPIQMHRPWSFHCNQSVRTRRGGGRRGRVRRDTLLPWQLLSAPGVSAQGTEEGWRPGGERGVTRGRGRVRKALALHARQANSAACQPRGLRMLIQITIANREHVRASQGTVLLSGGRGGGVWEEEECRKTSSNVRKVQQSSLSKSAQ